MAINALGQGFNFFEVGYSQHVATTAYWDLSALFHHQIGSGRDYFVVAVM